MKCAVILMNLGTPVEPNRKAVRAFLKEFLSDRRVVELFRPLWMMILYCIILVFRSVKVTKSYQKIWGKVESPLRTITNQQAFSLQQLLSKTYGDSAPIVRSAMVYSGPSLSECIDELELEGIEHFLVLPLYPQYSATTTGSIYDQVAEITKRKRNIPQIHIIKHYYEYPQYIKALADSVKSTWKESGQCDRLLMSFHSIPQAYSDAGDPYFFQCKNTAEQLASALGLNNSEWEMSFQSRLGYAKWLSPYTAVRAAKLPEEGIKHLDVICPAFSSDCLETLEEINIEVCNLFLTSGGEKFHSIPCLNNNESHIEMMKTIVENYLPSNSLRSISLPIK